MYRIDWQRLERVLATTPDLLAAWVFGSAQSGRIRLGGDLDLAVWFDAPPSLDQRADLRADLQQALTFDDIDLLVLNGASPIVRFEAVSGRLVFCRDAVRRAGFVSLTAREYEDEMSQLRQALAYTNEKGTS